MEKRSENKRSENKTVPLMITFFIIVFFILIFTLTTNPNFKKTDKEDLEGELSSLRWGSGGVEVKLEKSGDNIVLSLKSNFQDPVKALKAVDAIRKSVLLLIKNMKENGASVNAADFDLDFFQDDKLLKLNFKENIADVILNGTILFLDQAADYCGTQVVSDIIEKIEDSETHEVNLTASNCDIFDIPAIMQIVDLSEIYTNISQINNFQNITLFKNQSAPRALDLDNYFDYGDQCTFDASSEQNHIAIVIRDDKSLDIYPNQDWEGIDKISINLSCNSKEISDYFYVIVLDKTNLSSQTDSETQSISNQPPNTDSKSNILFQKQFTILNPSPTRSPISVIVDKTETLSIENKDYESIGWYLNGELIQNKSNSYEFKSSDEGKYNIKVEIKNSSLSDFNLWQVIVTAPLEDNTKATPKQESDSSNKTFLIYLSIATALIIIILVIILARRKNKTL